MAKKIVLKVCIVCDKCKTCILKTVAKICGIKSLDLDAEKGTLTVIGDADADVCLIVNKLRKVGKAVEIVSVGPEKEEKKEEKEEKKEEKCKELPPCCNACRPDSFANVIVYEEEQPFGCTIF